MNEKIDKLILFFQFDVCFDVNVMSLIFSILFVCLFCVNIFVFKQKYMEFDVY